MDDGLDDKFDQILKNVSKDVRVVFFHNKQLTCNAVSSNWLFENLEIGAIWSTTVMILFSISLQSSCTVDISRSINGPKVNHLVTNCWSVNFI